MSHFSREQKQWAESILNYRIRDTNEDPGIETGGGFSHSLLNTMKARVIEGQTLSGVDLLNAKNTLSVAEQVELADFLARPQLQEIPSWLRELVTPTAAEFLAEGKD